MISKLPSAAEPIQLKQEEEVRVLYTVESLIGVLKNSGADAVGGHTRSHPEHDG